MRRNANSGKLFTDVGGICVNDLSQQQLSAYGYHVAFHASTD